MCLAVQCHNSNFALQVYAMIPFLIVELEEMILMIES